MTLFDMVRVSEINLNEKTNLPISPLTIVPVFVFLISICLRSQTNEHTHIRDEKVFFKSSSCLKYIQKNLIEITKKM